MSKGTVGSEGCFFSTPKAAGFGAWFAPVIALWAFSHSRGVSLFLEGEKLPAINV
jgi:hypothetical protein